MVTNNKRLKCPVTVIKVKSEIELINKFCDVTNEMDPEIISGYNSSMIPNSIFIIYGF